jgi:hypothetical protein
MVNRVRIARGASFGNASYCIGWLAFEPTPEGTPGGTPSGTGYAPVQYGEHEVRTPQMVFQQGPHFVNDLGTARVVPTWGLTASGFDGPLRAHASFGPCVFNDVHDVTKGDSEWSVYSLERICSRHDATTLCAGCR